MNRTDAIEGEDMSEWEEVTIEDVCKTVVSGGTPLTSIKEYYLNGNIPWLKTKEVNQSRIYSTENYITQLGLENSSAKLIPENSVTVAMYGDGKTAGRVCLTKVPLATNQACCNLIIDENIADAEFVFYHLRGSYDDLVSQKTGSGQQNLSAQLIRNFDIILPPLAEQKAIASVLSSLDDKIDLLHRQNKTLEAIGETLFRQWFIEDGEGDPKAVELGDVVETTSGGTPSRSKMEYYENGGINWVKSKELAGTFVLDTEEMITEEALKKSSAKLLPPNSILIAMYGATVGEYAITCKEMTCNQAVCALKPNSRYPYTFLFLFVKFSKDELINMAVGSAQQNISQLLIKKLMLPACHEKIQDFHKIVDPFFEKIRSNIVSIQTLEKLRDSLLPKLMSGEVRVNYNH